MKKIVLHKKAQKFLEKQDPKTKERIVKALNQIPLGDIKPLKGKTSYKRLRIGDFRIIFDDHGNVINIIDIGNRGDVYK